MRMASFSFLFSLVVVAVAVAVVVAGPSRIIWTAENVRSFGSIFSP